MRLTARRRAQGWARALRRAVARGGVAGAALLGLGCTGTLNVAKFPTSASLYEAGQREFAQKHWDNAVTAFERLTLDLGARDPLLPTAYWFLGQAHERRGEFLLAAQNFSRVAESFPEDTLADDALQAAGDAYARLWRKPTLDTQYGAQAQAQYRLLISLYPDSPRRAAAEAALRRLDSWYAIKDLETGIFYQRRKAFDSALIYLRDVVRNFPQTDQAREALLRMVQIYRDPSMNYQDDAKEACQTLRDRWPDDREVKRLCPAPAAAPARADSTAKPAGP